ncbi:hypothetical protein [Mesorhizobium sp. ES1-3]|uniref:hypothetical protein n=1 Tax=Mesorhizobium sp. ES1-3 TaxID=2876628 RepID=UPI001CCBB04D|nr:hypothetical protein [Mesorhizobium sp. ES1-3]MBZ9673432.1 hypothetical protein [Mesorhizobium sp. ES1-3]
MVDKTWARSSIYFTRNIGNCLGDVVPDDVACVLSTVHLAEIGDIVGIWLHPDASDDARLPARVRAGDAALIKILAAQEETAISVMTLNPVWVGPIPRAHIDAIHKVIGFREADGRMWMWERLITKGAA